MARQVIGGKEKKLDSSNECEKLVDSLRDLTRKAPKQVTLFKTKLPKLSQAESEYIVCANALKEFVKNRKYNTNLTIRQVCSFFAVQYRLVYKIECIDYNYFYASRIFTNAREELSLASNLELLEFIALSFIRFDETKHTLNLSDDKLHVSTFKQAWILQELNNSSNTRRFAGFY